MLELRNIVKSYEGNPLLRGISFTVAQDETVCLLGASGSGKSTLLKMIAGLDSPDSGHILFNDLDLAQTPAHLRDFGLVFQDYGLFPHLSIFDNVAFGLKMKSMESRSLLLEKRQQAARVQNQNMESKSLLFDKQQIQKRVDEMLSLVNLQGFESRSVTDLSGGEQQRVALARALAPSPCLLMFDEPLGALDKTLKEDLLNELRNILHITKVPAIYVTHDQEEAFAIADRILLLHDGQIIRDGKPEEVWNDPKSVHAARMLGMENIVEGEIIGDGKVKTEYGVFSLSCKHKHNAGEKISALIQRPPSPFGEGRGGEVGAEIQLTTTDVLFKRDGFEVKTGAGLIFHMKERPETGQVINIPVQVKCLA